ncbi:MAG TPA: GAF domain-containing protein [Vicinamibacteria bacterium]|nr:GAF domain-containing protein [Vicinamibacteria bacterium]
MSADQTGKRPTNEDRGDGYVRKVQEGTRRFVEDLMEQNQRLEALLVSLEAERLGHREEIAALKRELSSFRQEDEKLQAQVMQADEQNRRLAEKFQEVERQNSNLANLYVASHRIHGTSKRAEVLRAIEEIVINLIGCEELAVFEREGTEPVLTRIDGVGIDASRDLAIHFGTGVIGRAAQTGELYVRNGSAASGGDAEVTACIPLRFDGLVTGAIVVYRLLPHKPGLEEVDFALFDLLAMHAATALRFTALEGEARRPATVSDERP